MEIFKEIIKSKKFWYAVVAVIVTVVGFIDPDLGELTQKILYALVALILGQGVADAGKEAAKINKQ